MSEKHTYSTRTSQPCADHPNKTKPIRCIKKANKSRFPFFIILALITLIFAGSQYQNLTHLIHPQIMASGYKELLSTSIDEITETLSSAELNNPIFTTLIKESRQYPEAKILLANHEEYPEILLEFAGNRPETIPFVIDYPNHQSEEAAPISIIKDYQKDSIPLFIQWDKRWGYESYGNEFIATSACGPTALSMIVVGLTGDTRWNPKAVADFSYQCGYFYPGQGTSWDLMTEGAEKLGVQSRELPLDASSILVALENGHPIIASMKPGHFTKGGHFIVLTGISSDGSIIVNDPGSLENSKITWDLKTIMNETKNLWSFSAFSL